MKRFIATLLLGISLVGCMPQHTNRPLPRNTVGVNLNSEEALWVVIVGTVVGIILVTKVLQ